MQPTEFSLIKERNTKI